MTTPLYIFDLDGTISLAGHRLRFLLNKGDSGRWQKFYAACDMDEPNAPVISTMRKLYQSGADIWIFSGRSDEVRDKTLRWLGDKTGFYFWEDTVELLRMRLAGDRRPDTVLKQEWINEMSRADRDRVVAVFEDRTRVVEMWRSNGFACFQVAHGDF